MDEEGVEKNIYDDALKAMLSKEAIAVFDNVTSDNASQVLYTMGFDYSKGAVYKDVLKEFARHINEFARLNLIEKHCVKQPTLL